MAAPVSVDVNPSSSTQASSAAGSGFGGGLTFAFGGNPNLAFLTSGSASSPLGVNWVTVGIVVALVAGVVLWTHKR